MNKIKYLYIVLSAIFIALIGFVLYERKINEPTRVIERMLIARESLPGNKNKFKRFFSKDYAAKLLLNEPGAKTPVHILKKHQQPDNILLSFQTSTNEQTGQNQALRFSYKRSGLLGLYKIRIQEVSLLDSRYMSDFANILPPFRATKVNHGERFSLDGRFEISLENFKKINETMVGQRLSKYSVDVKFEVKPIDFSSVDLYLSIIGENNLICLKNQKVEIRDLKNNSMNVAMDVIGDFCKPDLIRIVRDNSSVIEVKI